MRFLLDGMLGSLSRWLRIIGYDSEYRNNVLDEDLLEEASNTRRILLTRDKELILRAKKQSICAFYVKGSTDEEQLKFLVKKLNLVIKPVNSRCPRCNGKLNTIDKESVKNLVPENTFKNFNDFWVCKECENVYWKGSHWSRIINTLEKVTILN
jgi:uncharacterized protein with PIN domain